MVDEKMTNPHKVRKGSLSLNTRIMFLLVIMLVASISLTSAFALVSMNATVNKTIESKANTAIGMLSSEFEHLSSTMQIYVRTIAVNDDVMEHVSKGDGKSILDDLTRLGSALKIDKMTITNSNGTVLARLHDPQKSGDNISYQNVVQNALAGNVSSEIEAGSSTSFSIKAGSPIRDVGGTLIGAITVSYQLDNADFLDKLKASTGDEYSIFENGKRINTTIIENGKRVLGTNLDTAVMKAVTSQEDIYLSKTQLFGKDYIAAYVPILSSDGSEIQGIIGAATDLTDTEQTFRQDVAIIVGFVLFAMALSIFITLQTLKLHLKLPLKRVVSAAKAIENGKMDDVTDRELALIQSRDEIGALARSMEGALHSVQSVEKDIAMLDRALEENDLSASADTMRHEGMYQDIIKIVNNLFHEIGVIIEGIRSVSLGVDNGSSHVSEAAQTLAQGTTEQASAVEELSATISEVANQVRNNAKSADGASRLTKQSRKEVMISDGHMEEMVRAMNEISRVSGEIGTILKTIDDIAFQTNILALNAAVEAARAGDAGRGFAVVADEVRNLANRSAEAAKSTTELIGNTVRAVENGVRIAMQTAESLKKASELSGQTESIVGSIAEETQRQTEAIHQINLGIEQVSTVVQNNSATAEETAAASQELSSQSDMLQKMVSKYKL